MPQNVSRLFPSQKKTPKEPENPNSQRPRKNPLNFLKLEKKINLVYFFLCVIKKKPFLPPPFIYTHNQLFDLSKVFEEGGSKRKKFKNSLNVTF
jgi:hypothetical protein